MSVFIENRQKKAKLDIRRIQRMIHKLMLLLKCTDYELSIVFVDNEQIRELNRQYLERDLPTNVLSFPLAQGEYGTINPGILGDIVISVERAGQDAATGGLSLDDEIDFLMIHGLLHLLGYDHEDGSTEEEAAKMRKKEDALFLSLKGYELERL